MLVTFVYSIPDWLLCVLVIALTASLAMGGLWLVHRRIATEQRRRHNEIAGYLINSIGVVFAVILAFIAVAVWENAGKAQGVVEAEANEATDVLRNAAVYPPALARRVHAGLQQYLALVITEEWTLQQNGAMSPVAWQTIDGLHDDLLAFKPSTAAESIVHTIVLEHVDALIDARRSRQHMMGSGLNGVIWIVLVVLAALTIVSCYFVGSHGIRVQMMLTGFVGAAIGAMLAFIVAMDYPFRGSVSIDSAPFQRVLDDVDRVGKRLRS